MANGVEAFCEGLKQLGYEPEVLPGFPDHVTIAYQVASGTHVGKDVRLGFVVPADFPVTAPSGPHHSPIQHQDDGTGQPPRGGAHLNHNANFKTATGLDWQYWSRPYPGWGKFTKPAHAYMAFINQLWSLI